MNVRQIIALVPVLLLSACATVSFDYPREESVAIDANTSTALKTVVDEWRAENPGPSGFFPLMEGMSALGARIRLIELAEKSVDAQYFLMKGDTAGQIFAGALLKAADRGVRVRFLLDDIFTTVKDKELEVLDAHPNIEVRLFNPISRRGFDTLNFLGDFRRANRRMHNKSFTVDNQVTIVGGRNIANEYFDLRPEGVFLDLDVIGIGPVAARVSSVFDRYWNHERALPLEAVASKFKPEDLEALRRKVIEGFETAGDSAYSRARTIPIIEDLFAGRSPLYSASADVFSDEPDKLIRPRDPKEDLLVQQLVEVVGDAQQEVVAFTPYLVPGDKGVEFWSSLAARGVRVTLLTNSLASNNHASVHSAYRRYRKPLLEAGVNLYEVRADAVTPEDAAESLTLHTKGLVVDRKHVFIGSFNMNSRSVALDSEMGLLIDSQEMGAQLAELAYQRLEEIAYRVAFDERGRLEWHARIDGVEVVETSEPQAGGWKKFLAFLLRIVPESQL